MSWLNPFGIFTGGIDLEAEQLRAKDLRARELAQTEERAKAGLYASDGAYRQDYNRRADAPLFGYESDDNVKNRRVDDARSEVVTAAAEGAKSGLNNLVDGTAGVIGNTLDTVGGFAWKALPWWVWVGALAYGFFALGGLRILKTRFK